MLQGGLAARGRAQAPRPPHADCQPKPPSAGASPEMRDDSPAPTGSSRPAGGWSRVGWHWWGPRGRPLGQFGWASVSSIGWAGQRSAGRPAGGWSRVGWHWCGPRGQGQSVCGQPAQPNMRMLPLGAPLRVIKPQSVGRRRLVGSQGFPAIEAVQKLCPSGPGWDVKLARLHVQSSPAGLLQGGVPLLRSPAPSPPAPGALEVIRLDKKLIQTHPEV